MQRGLVIGGVMLAVAAALLVLAQGYPQAGIVLPHFISAARPEPPPFDAAPCASDKNCR